MRGLRRRQVFRGRRAVLHRLRRLQVQQHRSGDTLRGVRRQRRGARRQHPKGLMRVPEGLQWPRRRPMCELRARDIQGTQGQRGVSGVFTGQDLDQCQCYSMHSLRIGQVCQHRDACGVRRLPRGQGWRNPRGGRPRARLRHDVLRRQVFRCGCYSVLAMPDRHLWRGGGRVLGVSSREVLLRRIRICI